MEFKLETEITVTETEPSLLLVENGIMMLP